MTLQLNKSFLQEVNEPLLSEKGIRLFVKRDDLIHPYVSGNKWRKLKYNIEAFLYSGKEYILTIGGALLQSHRCNGSSRKRIRNKNNRCDSW